MTDAPLPSPLVPAEVDLRDFAFMPLDVQRLRDSDLTSDETPEACWAAVLLWCASWHQIPAASIPDNDQWMAKQTGYALRGRIDKGWRLVRDGALRGWVLCSDGRRYHPVVAEKALEAWRSKLEQRWKTECARIKKHNQRHGARLPLPEFDAWMSSGCPQGHPLPVPEDKGALSPGSPQEFDSKGQGEGQGQGQRKTEERIQPGSLPDEPDTRGHTPTPAGAVCKAMRQAGFAATNPGDPRLLALLDRGIPSGTFVAVATEAAQSTPVKGWAWVLKVAEARHDEAAAIGAKPSAPAPAADAWTHKRAEVVNRGCQLGLGPWDEYASHHGGETFDTYRRRVIDADRQHAGEPA